MAFGPPGPDSAAFFRRILPPEIGLLEAWHPNFGDCLFSAIEQLLGRGHAGRRGAQLRQPDLADVASGRDRKRAGAAGRPRRSRPLRSTAAITCSASSRRIGGCSRTSPGAPSTWREQTLERAAEIGLRVHVLPPWYDVDDAESLRHALHPELCERRGCSRRACTAHRCAAHSARLMGALLADTDLAGRLACAVGDGRPEGRRMTQRTGLDWQFLTLGGVLLALTRRRRAHGRSSSTTSAPATSRLLQAPFYALAAWLVVTRPPQEQRRALLTIIVLALAMRALLLPGTPVSTDIFRYVWDGRVQAAGINPYLHVPAAEALQQLRDAGDLSGDQPRRLRADDLPADGADRVLPGHAHLRVGRVHEGRDGRLRGAGGLGDPAIAGGARAAVDPRAALCLASAAAVGVRAQRPCRRRGDRVPDARLRRRRPPLAGAGRHRARRRHAGQVFPDRGGPEPLPALGLAPAGRLRGDRSRCSTCRISASAPKVFGFLGQYVSEERLEQGSGIFLWLLLGTRGAAPGQCLRVLSPGRRCR